MTNRRVVSQAKIPKEVIENQKLAIGEERLTTMLSRSLVEQFVNEILFNHMQDIKMEEIVDPDGSSKLQIKMELFVFNREELKGLVAMVKNGIEII